MTEREIRPFRLPLRTRFRGLDERRGCLIEGDVGWGEFAPFPDYPPEADARWLTCALEQADGRWPPVVRDSVEVNAIVPQRDRRPRPRARPDRVAAWYLTGQPGLEPFPHGRCWIGDLAIAPCPL
jgi:hypothetical protein